MRHRKTVALLLAVPLVFLIMAAAYALPPVHDRLAWRIDSLRTQVQRAINPPEQVVFVPQEGSTDNTKALMEQIVQQTLQAFEATLTAGAPTATVPATLTPVGPTATPPPSPTPSLTPTPIPAAFQLTGFVHEYQKFNNCGPATLSVALKYWGWQGDQIVTRAYLRPLADDVDDKNVSPDEMVRYIEAETGLEAVARAGGDLQMLKRLVAAGFPVIVEQGFDLPNEDWMGHYRLISGYDDGRARFTTQDVYIMADFPVPYEDLEARWRDFNDVYVIPYPPEREPDLMAILGPQADPAANWRYAAGLAEQEAANLSGRDRYFALFNQGSNLVALGDYAAAAAAYDQAFSLYPSIPEADRPWRMLWYQHGPYAAYYEMQRYADVINLADSALTLAGKPTLEEAFFWRGLAKEGLGDVAGAVQDLQKAYNLNPHSTAAGEHLTRLGVALP